MKKEKLNLYILLGCLALTVLFAILTIVYMIKSFNAVGVIALVVDIFALGVIASCFLQEKQETENEDGAKSEDEENSVVEEVAVEEVAIEETSENVD